MLGVKGYPSINLFAVFAARMARRISSSKEEFGKVRVVMQGENPWFVASDVAKALGYERPNDAVNAHCKKVSKFSYGNSPQGATPYNIIPESDVYRLVMRSNLPKAVEFQDWICEEVIPSIRRSGAYVASTKESPRSLTGPGAHAIRKLRAQLTACQPGRRIYENLN